MKRTVLFGTSLVLFFIGIILAFYTYAQYFLTMHYWIYFPLLRYPMFLALGWITLCFIAAYVCASLAWLFGASNNPLH
jgi:hypothetical protein